jgi:hypothetical protein
MRQALLYGLSWAITVAAVALAMAAYGLREPVIGVGAVAGLWLAYWLYRAAQRPAVKNVVPDHEWKG